MLETCLASRHTSGKTMCNNVPARVSDLRSPPVSLGPLGALSPASQHRQRGELKSRPRAPSMPSSALGSLHVALEKPHTPDGSARFTEKPEPRREAATRPRPCRGSSRPTWSQARLLCLGAQPGGKLWVMREGLAWAPKTSRGRGQPQSAGSPQAGRGRQEVQGHSVLGPQAEVRGKQLTVPASE